MCVVIRFYLDNIFFQGYDMWRGKVSLKKGGYVSIERGVFFHFCTGGGHLASAWVLARAGLPCTSSPLAPLSRSLSLSLSPACCISKHPSYCIVRLTIFRHVWPLPVMPFHPTTYPQAALLQAEVGLVHGRLSWVSAILSGFSFLFAQSGSWPEGRGGEGVESVRERDCSRISVRNIC